MIRLLLTLNAMLIVVIVSFTLTVNTILGFLLKSPIEDHYQRLGQGTMQMLNESVVGMSANERQEKLAELQPQFVYPLKLRQFDELKLSEDERERLVQGLVLQRDIDDTTHLYANVADSESWAWEFAVGLPKVLDEANSSAGTYYLLQQELATRSASEWEALIAKRQQQFGFPVVLQQLDTLSLSKVELQQLATSETLVVIHDEYTETHYQQVADSDYVLQLGMFETPQIGRYLNLILPGVLLFLILLASSFWLVPLWRNLMQIRAAAEAFGNGEYDTRVPYHKRSQLAVLTHAFNAMAERTQNSIRSQKELTGAVSHELRTPVARMRFALDMLSTAENADDRQRYIENMGLDIAELNDLLEELLTYSRLGQSADTMRSDMTNTTLQTWFTQVMSGLEHLVGTKKLVWHTENIAQDETTLMSAAMMNRAVNNLVQNALRYAGSRVEVLLSKTTDSYVLQVDDDGPGIPESEHERLFSAFAIQEDSRNKALAGFGLGLAIVKRIVEGHQGEVVIGKAGLGGARFIVRWPIRS